MSLLSQRFGVQQQLQQQQPQPQQGEGFLRSLLSGLVDPFAKTGRTIGGGGLEILRALSSPFADFDQAAQARVQGTSPGIRGLLANLQTAKNPLLSEEKLQQISSDPSQAIADQIKASAGVASFAIPFGKGASLASKVFAPGAAVGGLQAFSEGRDVGGILQGAGAGAAGAGVLRGATKLAKGAFTKPLQFGQEKGAQGVLKATPKQFQDAADVKIDINQAFIDLKPTLGTTLDDMLGPVAQKAGGPANKGTISQLIGFVENTITNFTKSNPNLRVDGSKIVGALRNELAVQQQALGGGSKVAALKKIIAQAEKKYAKGVSFTEARKVLKDANNKFGKAVSETEKGAVASSAQKIEAKAIREALRSNPVIDAALTQEQKLIFVREALKGSRAASRTGSVGAGRFDITRPGTAIDAVLGSPQTGGRLAGFRGPQLPQIPGGQAISGQIGARIPGAVGAGAATPSIAGAADTGIPAPGGVSGELGTIPTQQQVIDPYPLENMLADVQRDPENASAYQSLFKTVQASLEDQGGGKLTANQSKRIGLLNQAEGILNTFAGRLLEQGAPEFGPQARVQGFLRTKAGEIGIDPKAGAFNRARTGARVMMARALGEVGNLSEAEQSAALDLIPSLGMSRPEIQENLAILKTLVDTIRDGVINQPTSAPPSGLEQAVGQFAPGSGGGGSILDQF